MISETEAEREAERVDIEFRLFKLSKLIFDSLKNGSCPADKALDFSEYLTDTIKKRSLINSKGASFKDIGSARKHLIKLEKYYRKHKREFH